MYPFPQIPRLRMLWLLDACSPCVRDLEMSGSLAGESKGTGVVLGSGVGVQYVEPGAAVPLNNDLAAARAEALTAEEAVLWQLTGLVIDHHAELAGLLAAVVWLDVASARHRCVLRVICVLCMLWYKGRDGEAGSNA